MYVCVCCVCVCVCVSSCESGHVRAFAGHLLAVLTKWLTLQQNVRWGSAGLFCLLATLQHTVSCIFSGCEYVWLQHVALLPLILLYVLAALLPGLRPCCAAATQIVANHKNGIDTDKIDYLKRDARMSGVGQAHDYTMLLHNCKVSLTSPCLSAADGPTTAPQGGWLAADLQVLCIPAPSCALSTPLAALRRSECALQHTHTHSAMCGLLGVRALCRRHWLAACRTGS